MPRTLLCEVVTPERIVYHNEVLMVVATTVDGEIGILPLHAPLVTLLKSGEMHVKVNEDETDWIVTSAGYLQVHEDKVIVLADRAELASQIDVGRAREAKAAIEKRLAELPAADENEALLEDLRWYEAQIQVAGRATQH